MCSQKLPKAKKNFPAPVPAPSGFPNVLTVLLPGGARRQIATTGAAQIDAPTIRQGHGAKGCEDDLVPGSQPGNQTSEGKRMDFIKHGFTWVN